jgi:DNA-binding GntR family transcriptional regulator
MALGETAAPLGESNWAFHGALYRASGWQRGLGMVASLHVAVAPYLVLYTTGLRAGEESDAQHRRLLHYCRVGRVEEAVAVLEEHLEMASTALCEALDERGPPEWA